MVTTLIREFSNPNYQGFGMIFGFSRCGPDVDRKSLLKNIGITPPVLAFTTHERFFSVCDEPVSRSCVKIGSAVSFPLVK